MYDLLLFLHVLTAAGLFATIATFTALSFGAAVDRRSVGIANALWALSLISILVLGVLLIVVNDDDAGLPDYGLFDGWILLAIVLWLAAGGFGDAAQRTLRDDRPGKDTVLAMDSRQRLMHWLRVAAVIALLVVMVWKPGA